MEFNKEILPGQPGKKKSKKTKWFILFFLILVPGLVAGFVFYRFYENRSVRFRANGNKFEIYRKGEWQDFYLKGVNLGSTKPGFFPGQMGIKKDDYTRWFKQIADMNANVIRVYTIQNPQFYQAFFEYNMLTKKPLYLLHGVWVNDIAVEHYKDAFEEKLTSDYLNEIRNAIDVMHGRASLPTIRGHASGAFRFDISPYVMGYILVQEMEPDFVGPTNEKNSHINGFDGEYLYSEGSTAYEAWLAFVGNYCIAYEQEKYGGPLKPMSWTNWVTTDPLTHTNEPGWDWEDSVSVNTNTIYAKEIFTPGIFASYHVYPYFPDFFRFQPEYISYVDSKGKLNPYEAYLKDLKAFHPDMPIIVAEFGLPTSRGVSHRNAVMNYNHGRHTEEEQGEGIADMFDSIYVAGFAGGLLFEWQDEWFKRTWNIEEWDMVDQRPYWMNHMVSEQNYGIMAMEPGWNKPIAQVDGNISEWKNMAPICLLDGVELYAMNDERAIYFMIRDPHGDVENDTYYIGADIIRYLGSRNNFEEGITFSRNVDVIIAVNGRDNSRVLVEAYQDPFYRYYARWSIIERNPAYEVKDSGIFNIWRTMLSRELLLPLTGENIPLDTFEAGRLLHGVSNPDLPGYSNLADFYINIASNTIELRIPWFLLKANDPSTMMFTGDLYQQDDFAVFDINPVKTTGIYFELHKSGNPIGSEPFFYSWHAWGDSPSYHERLKKSYPIIQKKFSEY